MANEITPFLMFEGPAEEAMRFYISLFEDSEVVSLVHFGEGHSHAGKVQMAKFRLGKQTLLCMDSTVHHAFTFTPSVSLFVECGSEDEIERLYKALGEGGQALMPIDNYGFSRRFGWVNDRFGVSWQVNLP
jgi:predicted 3-demethylubiquinone-9 3-methyltransferase (glyoxalase superfamily)